MATFVATEQGNSQQISPEVNELQQSAQRLAMAAMWLFRVRAIMWWLVAALASLTGLIVLDYVFRTEELGLRWLLTVAWLAILAFTGMRWLLPAFRFELNSLRVADWIESQRPELGGRLSNALAIADLPKDDERFGSMSLRAAALSTLPQNLLELPWRSFLSYQATWRAALSVVAMFIVVGTLAALFPMVFGIGVKRLFLPWSEAPWPRADQLVFQQLPELIASGSDLQIEVIDLHPPLPLDLELQIKTKTKTRNRTNLGVESIDRSTRSQSLRILNDKAIATLPQVSDDIEIRVVGGDDRDTQWHSIRVVELPELIEYDFHVEPPGYSRQRVADLVGQRIEVLLGSKVTFRGRFDGRMQEVDAVSVTNESSEPESWSGELASDRQSFNLFSQPESVQVVTRDRSWKLRLTSDDGLQVTDPAIWTIHSVADRPPSVNLSPLEPNWVTQDSPVIVVGQATDDLELVEVKLVWNSGDTEKQSESQVLFRPDELPAGTDMEALGESRRQTNLEYRWQPPRNRFSTGQQLSFYLEASDSLGQISRSAIQTLQIQDSQTVLAMIEAEEAKSFEPLRQLLEAQRRNQQTIQRAAEVIRETRHVFPEQLEAISAARQLEQSIAQQLANLPGSIQNKLELLSRQLDQNGLSDSPLAAQITALSQAINKLSVETIRSAVQELNKSQTLMSEALAQGESKVGVTSIYEGLESALTSQRQATSELSKIVDSIARSETYAKLQKQLMDLVTSQQQVRAATERFQIDRMTQPDVRSNEATRVGVRLDQQNLASQVDSVAEAIEKMIDKSEMDRKAKTALERARKILIDGRASDQMREIAQSVHSQQLTEAIKSQHNVTDILEKAANLVTNRGEQSLSANFDSLQSMASQIGQMADEETAFAHQLQQTLSAGEAEIIAQEQMQLAERAKELNQQLQNDGGPLSEILKQAGETVESSAKQAREKNFAESAKRARDATEKFRSAQQTAQQRAADLEEELAQQQLLDLATAVTDLIGRQKQVVAKLEDVQARTAELKETPTAWENAVRESAGTQETVRQRLVEASKQTQALDAFAWLFKQCELDMARAVAALEREKVAPEAMRSASDALSKLEAAGSALDKPENKPDAEGKTEETGKEEGQKSETQRMPSIASLKLLRVLQTTLRDRTAQLEREGQDAASTQMLQLAQQQEALAELTGELLERIMKQPK